MEAVKMVHDDGLSKAEVGRRLGVSQSIVGNWVQAFQADGIVAFPGQGKMKPLDEENCCTRAQILNYHGDGYSYRLDRHLNQ